jgi:hypothetical protein
LWPVHLVLRALQPHWYLWFVHLWQLEELARLREAGPNIASRRLFREWRFLLAILLHSLDLVLNHDDLINHVLEIDVEQLELNVVIQPIHEHVLLLLIRVDVVHGVSRQLDE